jgi:hypothetical protein
MNPLSINPAIALDHALRSASQERDHHLHHRQTRRPGRAVHAARTARTALERAGL